MTNPPGAATESFLRRSRTDLGVAFLLLAASLFFNGALWLGGAWYVSHEFFHPLLRLFEYDAAFRDGQFPVRWCDNLVGGFGYPFFNFYAPFCFVLAEPFYWVGLTLADSMKAQMTLTCWLGGVGMYGLLRQHTGRFGAVAGALLFLFAPYHVMTVYVRNNPPEFTALSVWPWVFWGLEAAARGSRRWRGAALPLAALAVAVLTTSHVLTAYMAAWNLVVFAAFLILACRAQTGDEQGSSLAGRALVVVAVGLFGAALSAFFWLPAFAELRYCVHRQLFELTRIQDHFVYPFQLVTPLWGYGSSVAGAGDTLSFQLGLALWAGVIVTLVRGRRWRGTSEGPLVAFSLTMLAIHLFAMTPGSEVFWRWVPGAKFLQFPWRLLIPATFWAAVAGGLGVGRIFANLKFSTSGQRLLGVAILAFPAALSAPYVHPLFYYDSVPPYSPELVRRLMTDTAEMEYLPVDVRKMPGGPALDQVLWISAEGEARRIAQASAWHRFHIRVAKPGTMAVGIFWFPGWRVEDNGEPVETMPVTAYGLLGWMLPAGEHDVVVRFGETPLRRTANGISLAAACLAVAWIVLSAIPRRIQGGGKPRQKTT